MNPAIAAEALAGHVLVLIASPDHPVLDAALVQRAAAVAGPAGPGRVLAEGVAVEWALTLPADRSARALADQVRDALAPAPVDVAVVPQAHRRKQLLLADMDSTLIHQECIDELADVVGRKAEVSQITERAMRGEIAFEPALVERVALLAGLPAGVIDQVIAERITLMPGSRELVATMRAAGAHAALVSGGFTLFTGVIAARLGFDEHRANRLGVSADGASLTGTVEPPILGRDAKRAALIDLRERLQLVPLATLAVGDGANDLAMLAEAGLGVAFRAKPAVAAAAAVRIDHGDLTALLYLQGYARAEFRS